jgi:hypothetical protein
MYVCGCECVSSAGVGGMDNDAHIHAYMHTYTHTCIRTYIHRYTYIHTYIHTYINAYIHMNSYMHTHTHIDAYIHACIHTCMHTYTHTYVDTFIHTYLWLVGYFVQLDGSCHGHARSQTCEFTFNQFLGSQRAMPVTALGHWLGQDDPGSVHGLPHVLQVHAACHYHSFIHK